VFFGDVLHDAGKPASVADDLHRKVAELRDGTSQFTCCTSTKVQIRIPEELRLLAALVQTCKYWHLRSCGKVLCLPALLVQKYKYGHLGAESRRAWGCGSVVRGAEGAADKC
jgi:hypothetical protein